MKIIFINGPPRAGKDTVGNYLFTAGGYMPIKFAQIVKEKCHASLGLVDGDGQSFKFDIFETVKDIVLDDFMGVTPRQAYQYFSERYMKPLYGPSIFGELLLKKIKEDYKDHYAFCVTDSGFYDEAEPLVEEAGPKNCLLLRIHRKNKHFINDTRSYIDLSRLGVPCFDVKNPEGDRRLLFNNVAEAVQHGKVF
jgi:hypothetical protein